LSLAILAAAVTQALSLGFDDFDVNPKDGSISSTEYDLYIAPRLAQSASASSASFFTGSLSRVFAAADPGAPIADDLAFVPGFFNSLFMIIATELGDKTFFIAAIMSMRTARMPVFLGAVGALIVMTVLSSFMGVALPALMDRKYTHFLAGILFLYFGVKLLYDSREMVGGRVSDELAEVEEELVFNKKDDHDNERDEKGGDLEGGGGGNSSGGGMAFETIFTQSFTMTFLAEWGDRSQIATIALASHKSLLGTILGGCIGHSLCTGLACVGGKALSTKISEKTATIGGGVTFLLFGLHALLFEE
jgi:putative Ca2+/H+ antiporter (TMEM165/GDT1 family)